MIVDVLHGVLVDEVFVVVLVHMNTRKDVVVAVLCMNFILLSKRFHVDIMIVDMLHSVLVDEVLVEIFVIMSTRKDVNEPVLIMIFTKRNVEVRTAL